MRAVQLPFSFKKQAQSILLLSIWLVATLVFSTHQVFAGEDYISSSKHLFAGSSITVPEGEVWVINKMLVDDGSGFGISVSSIETPVVLKAGESFIVPVMLTEFHLLDNPDNAQLILKLNEYKAENYED